MSFKITSNLQSGANLAKVVYANQQENLATDADDTEILYYSNGSPTSSPQLTFDGDVLRTPGQVIGSLLRAQAPGGATGSYVDISALSNASFIDFGSSNGSTSDFNSRILSFLPNPAFPEQSNLAFQTLGNVQVLAPIQLGSPIAPAFKLDYGRVVLPGALNAQVAVVFTVGLFTTNPFVYLTVVSPITDEANAQPVFVESLTPTGCNVQFIGTPSSTAPGTFCNWLALGI